MEQKIGLWDADGIAYNSCYQKKDEPEKTLAECLNHTDNIINEVILSTGITHYIMTLTISKCFRYHIEPNYKKNRVGKPKPKYFEAVRRYLISAYGAIHLNGYESDDLIVHLNRVMEDSKPLIISADQDLLKIAGTHYDCKNKKFVTTTFVEQARKFYGDCIAGQSGDSIPGLYRKGDAFVDKLFEGQNPTDYGILVAGAYRDHYKHPQIAHFELIKTKLLLKLVDNIPGFVTPLPVPIPKIEPPQLSTPLPELTDNELNFLL
jgi:5'-3' exonuclease